MKQFNLLLIALTLSLSLAASEDVPTQEEVAKLYVATFNRAPDAAGLDYWTNASALKLSQIAQSFFDQPETQTTYPPSTSNRDFVYSIYQNLFAREPDAAGWDYWENELNVGSFTKNRFIEAVINGAQNTATSSDIDILTNKTTVGLLFSSAGLNNVNDAKIIMAGVTADATTMASAVNSFGLSLFTPVETTPDSMIIGTGYSSSGTAYDGTNYLVGLEYNIIDDQGTVGAKLLKEDGTIGPLLVNSTTACCSFVSYDGDRYLTIWEEKIGDCQFSIKGQFVSRDGFKDDNSFSITGDDIFLSGAIPMAYGDNKYLVVHEKKKISNLCQEENHYNTAIYGHFVGTDGTVGSEFKISDDGREQSVIYGGGKFFVVWSGAEASNVSSHTIYARIINSDGSMGSIIQVYDSNTPKDNPVMAAFDGINYLVTWSEETGDDAYNFNEANETMNWDNFGQLVSQDGNLVGNKITVTNEQGMQILPAVAFDGTDYLVSWIDISGTNSDIFAVKVSRNGNVYNKFAVSTESTMEFGGVGGFYNNKYLFSINKDISLNEGSSPVNQGNLEIKFLQP